MNDNPILACILFAKSQGLACADEAEAERDALMNVAALAFLAVESFGAIPSNELPAALPALDHYLANGLDDDLWKRINELATALRGVEQRAEDDPDSPLTNPAYDVPGQPRFPRRHQSARRTGGGVER